MSGKAVIKLSATFEISFLPLAGVSSLTLNDPSSAKNNETKSGLWLHQDCA